MEFEFDAVKNERNWQHHGIDFELAQRLWLTTHAIFPAKTVAGEKRYIIVGEIFDQIYIAVFVYRGKRIRLISCHRADKRWQEIYEKYIVEEIN